MDLLPIFQWLCHTPLSITVLGGVILMVDLRIFGLGLKGQTASKLAEQLNPFLLGGLVTSAISGILLLSEEPIKRYYNPAFRAKMLFLMLAVAFYFFVQQRVSGGFEKWAGTVSLLLWLGVGLAGRAIGFN